MCSRFNIDSLFRNLWMHLQKLRKFLYLGIRYLMYFSFVWIKLYKGIFNSLLFWKKLSSFFLFTILITIKNKSILQFSTVFFIWIFYSTCIFSLFFFFFLKSRLQNNHSTHHLHNLIVIFFYFEIFHSSTQKKKDIFLRLNFYNPSLSISTLIILSKNCFSSVMYPRASTCSLEFPWKLNWPWKFLSTPMYTPAQPRRGLNKFKDLRILTDFLAFLLN